MWIWLVISLLLVLYAYYRFTIRHTRKADEMFPGPVALPFLGNALQLFVHRGDLVTYGGTLIWFYRRSIRLWLMNKLNVIIVNPDDVEKIWSNTEHIEKSDGYDYLLDWIGRGLLTSTGDKWRRHRKILTPAFHFNILENFLNIFHANGDILIEKLNGRAGKPNFDVYQIIKLYALDNIAEAAMGTKVNAQIYPDGDYVKSIKIMCEIVMTRILNPWYWPNFIFNLSALGRRQKKALECIHGLTNEVIRKRKEEYKNITIDPDVEEGTSARKKRVFLDILLSTSDEGTLTNEEIREEVDTFMFEGHDTVTSALSFAIYSLAENPTVQERAFEEQYKIFGDDNRNATTQELNSMKYLEMVVKETLRLYPSVPIMARYVDKDVVLDERAFIPKGSQVAVLTQALHQTRGMWEKPDEFYPEHFEPDTAAKRHPFQYIPFSAGPRNCIGMRFAMLEMKATLSRILRNFMILPAEPKVPLRIVVDLIMVSESGVNIRLEKRKLPNITQANGLSD